MKVLANSYCSIGRGKDAIDVLAEFCRTHPADTVASLTLATWQAWFGQESDYESTRRRLVEQASGTEAVAKEECAAKAACLRPCTDASLLTNALNLARKGVEIRAGTPWLPRCQLSLGLAEYRNGQYTNAERTLILAEQTAGKIADIPATARLFRAMSLFRQDRFEEARQLFSQAEAQMIPFPQDENKPLFKGDTASHDVMISWLAYKEAKALIEAPSAP
jgi:tetratricopeptide (TPR) repeat protein